MRVSEIARTSLGIIYLAGAAINLRFALLNPEVYHSFADFAIPSYRILWSSIVMSNLITLLILVVAFEIALAILILSKGRTVKLGLAGGMAFNLFLIPFWWAGFALINLLLASAHLLLLREEYYSTIFELGRGALKYEKH